VRALVDVGRKPLAKALALHLPNTLEREREMWQRYSRFVRQPYDDSRPAKLNEFRTVDGKAGQRQLAEPIVPDAD
jgi:hypothetical protein